MTHRNLPGVERKPRAKRRVLMHVVDAGDRELTMTSQPLDRVRFGCVKCGHETGWVLRAPSTAKRGEPCPQCNPRSPA